MKPPAGQPPTARDANDLQQAAPPRRGDARSFAARYWEEPPS